MRTVYKYPIPVTDVVRLDLPIGAELLHVAPQGEHVCLWALVEPLAEQERRVFLVRGTGQPIADDLKLVHVGTFLIQSGSLVFHLFEVLL